MKTYDQYLTLIEQRLTSLDYPEAHAGLYAPIQYTLKGGGKRLRPVLTLAAAEACGLEAEQAMNAAMGMEMFHNFTLLHDDIMDRADMRRGRATVHVRWGTSAAILSGDAMLTMAGMLVGRSCGDDTRTREAMELFNTTAMGVYEGQQDDMEFEDRDDVTVDEYMEMIRLKTGVLIAGAAAMGAVVAGASGDVVKALYDYGIELGLAFQLKDDLLDTYGDPIVFGKEIGGDIVNDKKTWLNIVATAEDNTGTMLSQRDCPDEPADKIARVRAVYDTLGLPDRCTELIDTHVTRALASLDAAGLTPAAKGFFRDLALSLSTRSH